METHSLSALIGPITKELVTAWGVPGLIALLFIAGFVWWTKATSGIRGEMASAITRLDARVEALTKERNDAITEAHNAREEAYKWRESYLAKAYPNEGHEDIAAQTGMDKEQV